LVDAATIPWRGGAGPSRQFSERAASFEELARDNAAIPTDNLCRQAVAMVVNVKGMKPSVLGLWKLVA
jgi:hypothetical protein